MKKMEYKNKNNEMKILVMKKIKNYFKTFENE